MECLQTWLLADIQILLSQMPNVFFNYKRRGSVTVMLFDIGLPSFNTILNNARFENL